MVDAKSSFDLGLVYAQLRDVPHLEQYIGAWAIYEPAFAAISEMIASTDLVEHIRETQQAAADRTVQAGGVTYSVEGGIAMIDIVGVFTKYGSSFSDMREGTIGVRRAVRDAADRKDVSAILLRIDSPGGAVAGTGDLAADVAMAATKKRVTAYIEDLGASAAYYVASQASRVVANPSALVGSIGTFTVIHDYSEFFAARKVKVHLIKSGEMKGAGTVGTEVTEAQLADFQRTIDEVNSLFVAAVKTGRGMSDAQVSAVADGRVYVASKALALGLIDGVETFDQAFDALTSGASVSRRMTPAYSAAKTGDKTMSTDVENGDANAEQAKTATALPAPTAATFEQLQSLTGADNDFVCEQLKARATLDQARTSLMQRQQKRIDALQTENAEAKAKAEAAEKKRGVDPVRGDGSGADAESNADAGDAFQAAFDLNLKRHNGNRARAMSATVKENPDLHAAYLAAHNETHGRRAAG